MSQRQTDNSQLILFRIVLGVLICWQSFHDIFSGWVARNLIAPKFTFSHIGFEWLQPLPGIGMYVYYSIMGVCGLFVAIGLRYRLSLGLFTLLWTGTYLMQKTLYNNHYYLLILVCLIMLFLPANANRSIHSHKNIKIQTMPVWCRHVIILQFAIVYFFAAVSKLYPDWLDGTFTKLLLIRFGTPLGIDWFQQHWFHLLIAYGGILFDLLIVPLMLWRKTRWLALIAAFTFHGFNWSTLEIGIFPFFALSFFIFCIPPRQIRRWVFRDNSIPDEESPNLHSNRNRLLLLPYFFVPFFIIQLLLPLRHWLIKGDVLWTEEGHRLSWRMMLRQRSGTVNFKIVDKKTGKQSTYDLENELIKSQLKQLATHPDMIWQMAQRIKKQQLLKGNDVAVYVTAYNSVNKKPARLLIDPNCDLASQPWNYFSHSDFILTYD